MRKWRNLLGLFLTLAASWLVWSGFTEPFFLILGTLSCLLVLWLVHRMEIHDHEAYPLYLKWRAPFYFLWLFGQMLLSSFAVTRAIWQVQPHISPVIGPLATRQRDAVAKVLYGNSITLTPGTVCTDITGSTMMVHALHASNFRALEEGTMDRKVERSIG